MQLQFKAILLASLTALSSGVLATPTGTGYELQRRVLAPKFTFAENLADFPVPPAAAPGDKKAEKAEKAYKYKQPDRVKCQQAAGVAVTTLLKAAQVPLSIPDDVAVYVFCDFHTSKAEPTEHVTFRFNGPKCGAACLGHAFDVASAGRPGDIFASTGVKVFP
ncbi:hypothetical protein ONZ45_g11107 [Pleurotus djamor]|nr:hypothetical protein ONZ45_g11107 [Pleurotus djamor]